MFCANCGTLLADDTNFCPMCGQPVKGNTPPAKPVETPIYEICEVNPEIVQSSLLNVLPFVKLTWCWFADAVGPSGKYLVAKSSEFKAFGDRSIGPRDAFGSQPEESKVAHDELVALLLREGWAPIDTRYFGQSFQRRVKT